MDSGLTELPVRVRFPKGTRVRLTTTGQEWLGCEVCTGVVVGYSPRFHDRIAVVIDGQVSRGRYHQSYWERL